MMAEDWLCSRVKLCQLITGGNVCSSNLQDGVEAVINAQSYPQPYHNPSSLLLTLEAFSNAFNELRGGSWDVKMTYTDQNAFGPNPVQSDVVRHFAEMLSGDILDAAVRKPEARSTKDVDQVSTRSETSRWETSAREKIASRLVAEIYCSALEDLVKQGGRSEDRTEMAMNTQFPASCICSSMHQEGHATETHDVRRSLTNLDGMANQGSLDYPDAPPSTPLLPEMMKSRASFTRKLKGGLANEFLPSTPPPTPKDQQSHLENKMADSSEYETEFMVRLMRSLSLACSLPGEEADGTENKIRFQSEISEYAAQLSANIIQCITAGGDRSIETPVRDMQGLADHLAEKIIMTSIAEVLKCKSIYYDSPSSDSVVELPPVEALRAMASKLVTHTFIQAFSELECGSLRYTTSKLLPDAASDPAGEQGYDQALNTSLPVTQTNGGSNGKSNYMTFDPKNRAAEHFFAENIVHEVLKSSVREASNHHVRCLGRSVNSDRLRSSEATQAAIRAVVSETLSRDTRELQCVLLWVAASQMGTSTLQIDQTDQHIQQQLFSVSLQAQFHTWTVGHLMAALLQYCEYLQTASRGHSEISTSLLGHLLLTQA